MSLTDLFQYEEEKEHSFNSKKYSKDILDLSDSKISKTKFAEHYHILCRKCNRVYQQRCVECINRWNEECKRFIH